MTVREFRAYLLMIKDDVSNIRVPGAGVKSFRDRRFLIIGYQKGIQDVIDFLSRCYCGK